jgi:hypothetical protein
MADRHTEILYSSSNDPPVLEAATDIKIQCPPYGL